MHGSPCTLSGSEVDAPARDAVALSKSDLRTRFRLYRRGLSGDAYRRRSQSIVERCMDVRALQAATTVHAYWPQEADREVDTRPLIDALREAGVTVALPVVTSFERGAPAMEHRRYEGRETLTRNRWGLAEPSGTPRISTSAIDAVLVPAFGAGRNGHRIGHGFGYYDAFLSGLDAAFIGLVYDACLVPRVPGDAHDVPMDVIVTETDTLSPPLPSFPS